MIYISGYGGGGSGCHSSSWPKLRFFSNVGIMYVLFIIFIKYNILIIKLNQIGWHRLRTIFEFNVPFCYFNLIINNI